MPEELQDLESKRTRCEIYSRVVGYIRPVNQWNEGKQAEYADRVEFKVGSCGCE
jgi:anaerobic ribonucleoside-triphosphate reductase